MFLKWKTYAQCYVVPFSGLSMDSYGYLAVGAASAIPKISTRNSMSLTGSHRVILGALALASLLNHNSKPVFLECHMYSKTYLRLLYVSLLKYLDHAFVLV